MTAGANTSPRPVLARDEVHVWRVDLTRAGEVVRLGRTLSTEERARAGRFRFERDRDRFVAARGLLRVLLGRYLEREPAALRFCCGPHGKPALAGGSLPTDLRFNLAHAGGLALYAVAVGREVGIDLEQPGSEIDPAQIAGMAATWFSPTEQAALVALPPERRHAAFLAGWTLKEAYAKGVGAGLALPLDTVGVAFSDGRVEAVSIGGVPVAAADWTLLPLTLGPGLVAALAGEGRDWRLSCPAWPDARDGVAGADR